MATGGGTDRPHLRTPGEAWLPVVAPRHPGDPVPDLTLSRLLHRACAADLGPLAETAAGITAGGSAQQALALRSYLRGLLTAVAVQIDVEDHELCPLLLHRAGPTARDALTAAATDHALLAPHLARITALADAVVDPGCDPRTGHVLADTLHELDVRLRIRCADHELRLFPLIRHHLTVADHTWLQRRFHRGVPEELLGFVASWLRSHASAEDRDRLLEEPHQHIHPVARIFRRRFDTIRALALGGAGDCPSAALLTRRSDPRP